MAEPVTYFETLNTDDITSDGSRPSTILKKQRLNGEKTCRVCGDRALAHNFDVISCESCKAFFRRNALKTKIRPCAFNGDCEITPNTRRFCANCRLKTCLLRGMKSDMILDADEKKARQNKLTENRRKRAEEAQTQQQQQQQQHSEEQQQQQQPTSSLQDFKSFSPDLIHPPLQSMSSCRSRSGSESESCTSTTVFSSSGAPTPAVEDWVIPPPSTSTPVNRSLRGSAARSEFLERAKRQATLLDFSVLMPHQGTTHDRQRQQQAEEKEEIDTSFQHVHTDQLPSDLHQYWRMQDEDRSLLMELTIAYQETVLKLPEQMEGKGPVNVQSILNRCQRFARDIVNFVKRVPDFRLLRMEDQVAALKGASWRTFLVKSSANFVVERNAWVKDNGYLSVEEFTHASPEHRDRILLLARFSAALKHILRNDPTTFAVLQMLVLFDPRDPNLGDRQLVSRLADKYALLLKRLLQSQWSFHYAGHYLGAVRGKVQEMAWVAESIQVMFQDWLHLLEPLMREVLNLS